MVSNVLCDRHGPQLQEGILCCDHVREAIRVTRKLSFEEFNIDICNDGRMILEHMLCAQCTSRFSLSPSVAIPEETWANAQKFPYVCPACKPCFTEWSGHCKT